MNRQQRNDYHHELVEHLADADEAMGEIFLDERKPSEEEIHAAIRRATLKRAFTPVMMGTALKNKVSGTWNLKFINSLLELYYPQLFLNGVLNPGRPAASRRRDRLPPQPVGGGQLCHRLEQDQSERRGRGNTLQGENIECKKFNLGLK